MSEPGYVAPPDPTARRWHFYALGSGIFTGQTLSAPALALATNTPAGCGAYESAPGARPDILAQRVDLATGKLIDYQPPAPANDAMQTWAWDAGIKRWVSQPTLAAIKRDKLPQLKAAALAASEADITVQSVTFAADAATRAELAQELALAQAEGAGYSCDWQRADGTAITLTGAQVKGLLRQISNRLAAIRAQYRSRQAQVMAASTAAEVNAVIW